MKKLTWLLTSLMTLMMMGCLKDGSETIVLMGTESDVKTIEQVIPDTLLKFIVNPIAMRDTILNLPRGTTPPNIQGEYMFYIRQLYRWNEGAYVIATDTVCFRFGGDSDTLGYYPQGQHNMIVPCDFYGDIMEAGRVYLVKSQPKAYVMGNGNDFTAYFTVDYNCETSLPGVSIPYLMTRAYILTGTLTANGIDNAVLACVNKTVEGNDTPGAIIPRENSIFIYRVRGGQLHPFGSAKRQQWYQQ